MTDFLKRGRKKKVGKNEDIKSSGFPEDVIPDVIEIYYNGKDIEMEKIDEAIQHKYEMLAKNHDYLYEEKKEIEKKILISSTPMEKNEMLEEIEEIERKIKDYENNISLNKYISESKQILSEYKKLREEDKINLITKFIQIAKKYISIQLIRVVDTEFMCKSCGCNLEDLIEEIEGSYICQKCNTQNTFLSANTYIRDVEKLPSSSDDEISGFVKILDKFEGKQNPSLPNDFYQKLDAYFELNRKPLGEEIRKRKKLSNGKKEGTSKKILRQALESVGYSSFYEDANYIAHVYWGWDLPDISRYREQIIEDYQKTQRVWLKICHNYDRKASLGTQYRLYSHLRSVGYPVEKDDFGIQDSVDSLRTHNDAWEKMCSESGVKFYAVD